jgi:hypothetical protein
MAPNPFIAVRQGLPVVTPHSACVWRPFQGRVVSPQVARRAGPTAFFLTATGGNWHDTCHDNGTTPSNLHRKARASPQALTPGGTAGQGFCPTSR